MFFHTDLNKPFLYGPGKGLHKLLPQSWNYRMSLYVVALRFPFTGTKGPNPNHEKQPLTIIPPPPNFALCIRAGSIRLLDCQMVKLDSSLQRMFPLLQSPIASSFRPLQATLGIAHGDLRPVCGFLAIKNHFMKLPTNSYCADTASKGSLELGSEC